MLYPEVARIKHAILNIFIPEPFKDIVKSFPLPVQLSREVREKEDGGVAIFECGGFKGFRMDPVPVLIVKKVDQKGSGEVPRNCPACGYPMGSLNHIDGGKIHEPQQAPSGSPRTLTLFCLSQFSVSSDFATRV